MAQSKNRSDIVAILTEIEKNCENMIELTDKIDCSKSEKVCEVFEDMRFMKMESLQKMTIALTELITTDEIEFTDTVFVTGLRGHEDTDIEEDYV